MGLNQQVKDILKKQDSIKSARIVIDLNPMVLGLYNINKNPNCWCLFLPDSIIFNSCYLKNQKVKAASQLITYDIKQADLEFILKEIKRLT